MIAYRLWLQEPPNSPNCPPGLPGCFNTGAYDPDRIPKCYDAQQFATFQDVLAWAQQRGEQMMQTTSAANAYSLCSTVAPTPIGPQSPVSPPGGGTCANCGPISNPGGVPGGGNVPGGTIGGGGGVLPPGGGGSSFGGGGSVGGRQPGGDVLIDPTTGRPYAPGTGPGTTAAQALPWWAWLLIGLAVLMFLRR